MKNNIIIIGGDPNSINSEILYKCWNKLNSKIKKKIYVIANIDLLESLFKKLNYKINLTEANNFKNINNNALKIINVNLDFKNPFKINHMNVSKYVKDSLNLAHNLTIKGMAKGIINCPINKNIFSPKRIGVTEYLASICKVKKDTEVMLIANNSFSVSPITTHIDLKQVAKSINKKKIINKIRTINTWFIKYKLKKPKIGILGLNPHNAEMRPYSEELKIITPAIKQLRKSNIFVKGPLVADTIFIKDYKSFDVIVGMYHDQVLAPFKALFNFNAINITLGLKYLRLSPDHGVAMDIIGKNKASASSLLKCVTFLNNF